jgi:hypothetical protein
MNVLLSAKQISMFNMKGGDVRSFVVVIVYLDDLDR